jgi:hypothetical protein
MATRDKLVLGRIAAHRELLSLSSRCLAPALKPDGAGLGTEWGGQAMNLLGTVLQRLVEETEELSAASSALQFERIETTSMVAERDRCVAECRALLLRLRDALLGLAGPGYVRLIGLRGKTPTTPFGIHMLAAHVLDQVAKVEPPVGPLGVACDPVALVQPLGEPTARLDRLNTRVSDEEAQTARTQDRKNCAVQQFDRTFELAASLLAVLLRFAGKKDLAAETMELKRRAGGRAPGRRRREPDPAVEAEEASG